MKKIYPLFALIWLLWVGSIMVFATGEPIWYSFCSNEWEYCVPSPSGTTTIEIAFWANGNYTYKTFWIPAILCSNFSFWSDPVPWVKKACYKKTNITQALLSYFPWKDKNGDTLEEKQSNGYLVTIWTSKEVTVNYPSLSECKKITATMKNIFVPTLTANEWEKFKAGVSNVGGSIGNCGSSVVVGYGWDAWTWWACDAECGVSTTQYRTVQCRELTSLYPKVFGNVVHDAFCSNMAKPIDVMGCIGSNNCPVCNMNGVQDNGETGIDCGGPTCAACGQQQPTQTISGPSLQCIYFAPSMYYKINYYTQTNPNLGFIQDQIYNVAWIGNASFQGYGSLNTTASWAQPAENPPVAYTNASCTASTPITPSNSCAANPSFANIGQLTTGNPTQPWQWWTYSASPGNCTYTCTNGYSGDGCGTAPIVPTWDCTIQWYVCPFWPTNDVELAPGTSRTFGSNICFNSIWSSLQRNGQRFTCPVSPTTCYWFTIYQQPWNVDYQSADYSSLSDCNVWRSQYPATIWSHVYNNPTSCRQVTCSWISASSCAAERYPTPECP